MPSREAFMRAVQLVEIGAPLEDAEVSLPDIGASEVLVRVAACGICHSDAHYRAGISPIESLPVTLGHEVAGRVETIGRDLHHVSSGDRVYVHYLISCGCCDFCRRGHEQFCSKGQMIGKHRDGGYAEFIKIPGRNVFVLPDEIPFEHGAIMMCSSATSLHALHKARLKPGESVAIFGIGGLGTSAIQLAKILGAREVLAVDLQPDKLELAKSLGAVPIDARAGDPVKLIRDHTAERGVDVALELIGLPLTMRQSVRSLAKQGRAAIAGITEKNFEVTPYHEIVNRE